MTARDFYALQRATQTALRECGPCADGRHGLCTGWAFNRHPGSGASVEVCPCQVAGHETEEPA